MARRTASARRMARVARLRGDDLRLPLLPLPDRHRPVCGEPGLSGGVVERRPTAPDAVDVALGADCGCCTLPAVDRLRAAPDAQLGQRQRLLAGLLRATLRDDAGGGVPAQPGSVPSPYRRRLCRASSGCGADSARATHARAVRRADDAACGAAAARARCGGCLAAGAGLLLLAPPRAALPAPPLRLLLRASRLGNHYGSPGFRWEEFVKIR